MIPLGKELKLGGRAFFVILLRNSVPAICFFILAFAVIILGDLIQEGIVQLLVLSTPHFSSGGPPVAAAVYLEWGVIIIFILAALAFIIGLVLTALIYFNYTFTFEEFDLRLKRGILNIDQVSIPFRQIQDVNIKRSLLYRILGVSIVIIDSAGNEEMGQNNETDIILEPIDKYLAEDIRVLLQRKIGVQVIEHEKEADKNFR